MNKPAVYIDAFLADDKRHEIFNRNVINFINSGWDVFVISNKIRDFNLFSKVKYFEYDSTNRILPDRYRYPLPSVIGYQFFVHNSQNTYLFRGKDPIHGFTNWTLLYNLRHMAEIVKSRGYSHLITCEYDLTFKNYDLMNTIFKKFGTTENSTKCMIQRGNFGFGSLTSVYLINVDLVLNTIPILNTEDDYEKFLVSVYGYPKSPVYEELFSNLFIKYDANSNPTTAELLDDEYTESIIDRSTGMMSASEGNRQRVTYKNLILCPTNDNTHFFIHHMGTTHTNPIFVEYKTNGYQETFVINCKCWRLIPCKDTITVKTSEMIQDGINTPKIYNLVDHYDFTFEAI